MEPTCGRILIVDDNEINRRVLAGLMAHQGHSFGMAANGTQALAQLKAEAFDVVLLDVMMPEMDGYETLSRIKGDPALAHLPVIMISAVDEMESVIRCINMGATDYLPKPFNSSLLRARITTSLAGKRLRDLEREYLEQVGLVSAAASAIEAGTFKPDALDGVAQRADALGRLAKVFQHMAGEVYAREQRLQMQLAQLKSDIDEHLRSLGDTAAAYIPMDRRQALAHGRTLPTHAGGAALFADISGFTPLTESLAHEMGFQRGAEEITRQLNCVYDALVDQVHRHGGSVIVFGGDAITCWFDGGAGLPTVAAAHGQDPQTAATLHALACAEAMQAAMQAFATLQTPAGMTISIGIKVAVAAGRVRRFLVGDPAIQQLEVLAGNLLNELTEADQLAKRGEVLATRQTSDQADGAIHADLLSPPQYALVRALAEPVPESPWPAIPAGSVTNEVARPWLLPLVYDKVCRGESEYLSELRPAAALLLKFSGIDYDQDPQAEAKLDAFVRWVQTVLHFYGGSLVQMSIGDKGSSLCITFGAPSAHPDDAVRAVKAAWRLQNPPVELGYIGDIRIGLAHGLVRAGAYGGINQKAYGVIGDRINLAARLMAAAPADGILCDEAIGQMAKSVVDFEVLPPIQVKGKIAPVSVCRPVAMKRGGDTLIDQLAPSEQLVVKVASLLGTVFEEALLRAIHPVEHEKPHLARHLRALCEHQLLAQLPPDENGGERYEFPDADIQQAAYNLMLFSQRRQLHRQAAEWIERVHAGNLDAHHAALARHWKGAEDYPKAIAHLEKAGELARSKGQLSEAQAFLEESLALEKAGAKRGL